MAKQCWRLIRFPNLLLAKVLKAKYFPSCSFWEACVGRPPSHSWRSLIWGRRVLESGGIWRVGDGESIRIYKDSWLPNTYSSRILSPRILGEDATVSCLITDSGAWNMNLVRSVFSSDEAAAIQTIPAVGASKQDRFAWKYTSNGVYTVKNGYWEACKIGIGGQVCGPSNYLSVSWWRALWRLSVPSKVKLLLWRACHNAIPCFFSLASRRISDHRECPLCSGGEENVMHVFWRCVAVRRVWKQFDFYQILKNGAFVSFADLCSFVLIHLMDFQKERFAWTCWCGWNNRNAFIHHNFVRTDAQLLDSMLRVLPSGSLLMVISIK